LDSIGECSPSRPYGTHSQIPLDLGCLKGCFAMGRGGVGDCQETGRGHGRTITAENASGVRNKDGGSITSGEMKTSETLALGSF
jgi:hypothetical protein